MRKRKKTSKVRFVAFLCFKMEKKLKLNLLAETNESSSKSSEEESDEGLGDEIDEKGDVSLEDKANSKSKSKCFGRIENQSVVFKRSIKT